MAEWKHDTHAEVVTKLTEFVDTPCIAKFDIGEMKGIIVEIIEAHVAEGLQRSIDLSRFKIRLESGDVVIVLGSALSRVEKQVVAS